MSSTSLGPHTQQVLFGEVASGFDELTDPEGKQRTHWDELIAALTPLSAEGLQQLRTSVARHVFTDGISYNPVGAASPTTARRKPFSQEPRYVPSGPAPWPLDPIPFLLSAQDWSVIDEGLRQRVRLMTALLADIYGPQRMLEERLLPASVVFAHRGYLRMSQELAIPARGVFLHAADLGRGPDGHYRVYADRTSAPSGIGYAVAGRRALIRAAPGMFHSVGPCSLNPFIQELRYALLEAAPSGASDPTVVVFSPGTGSETAFDQAHLALMMGFPLVQAADLVVREGKLWMRSLGTLQQVDVVLRRVDSPFIDPLDLRPDSQLGVAGLVEAASRGTVAIVNSVGSGVLENPAFAAFLPALSQALLGEDLLLEDAPVLWGGHATDREKLLALFGEITIKDVVTGAGRTALEDPAKDREYFRKQLAAEPWRWVGQFPLQLSTAPVIADRRTCSEEHEGELANVPILLRCFTVSHGENHSVLPGGLGQVMARGAGGTGYVSTSTKDIWVTQSHIIDETGIVGTEQGARVVANDKTVRRVEDDDAILVLTPTRIDETVTSPRVLGDLFWIGRYGERAEALARLLIVIRERIQEQRSSVGANFMVDEPLRSIFGAVSKIIGGTPPRSDMTVEHALTELQSYTFHRERDGSLAHSVDKLGNAAQGVRDQLSVDTWMVLADLERALERPLGSAISRTWAEEAVSLSSAQSQVLAGMLALSGLSAESMVHDTGWRFMDIGKRIERGLQLTAAVRILLTKVYPPRVERPLMEALLSSLESAVIYRRRHHVQMRVAYFAELVFFDADNPRSLIYQLDALRQDLAALPDAASSTRAEHELENLYSVLRRLEPNELEKVSEQGERSVLAQWLRAVHTGLSDLALTIESTRLTPPSRMLPLWAGAKEQAWN